MQSTKPTPAVMNHFIKTKNEEQHYFDKVIQSTNPEEVFEGLEKISNLRRQFFEPKFSSISDAMDRNFSPLDHNEHQAIKELSKIIQLQKSTSSIQDFLKGKVSKAIKNPLSFNSTISMKSPWGRAVHTLGNEVTLINFEAIVKNRLNILKPLNPSYADLNRAWDSSSAVDNSEIKVLEKLTRLFRERRDAPTMQDLLSGRTSKAPSAETQREFKNYISKL